MKEILFYLLFALPFGLLFMFRDKRGAHVFNLTCANVLMLFYIVHDHLGLWSLFHSPGGIKQLRTVDQDTVILLAFYSLIVTLAYIGTGIVMGRKFRRVRVPDLKVLRTGRINWFPMMMAVLVLTPLALWKAFEPSSALRVLLAGDALGALEVRMTAVTTNTHFLGIKPSYLNTLWTVLGFVQIIAMVIAMARPRLRYVLFFLFVTVVFMLESFSGVSKGVIIGPLYILFFGYSLLFANGRLLNRGMVWAGLYVIGVVAAFTAWVAGLQVVDLWYPFERLFLGNLIPQYVVVERFNTDNLLYGTSTPSWFSMGMHTQFLLDVYAWREMMGVGEGALFYTAPSSFVAEAHANFHMGGVVVISFVIFTALRIVDYFIQTVRSELIYAALMVNSSLHFSGMAIMGAVPFMVDYYYWSILLFALVAYRISLARENSALRRQTAYGRPGLGHASPRFGRDVGLTPVPE